MLSNFQSNNYIEYKSNADKYKTLSVEEDLSQVSTSLKDIINNF